MKPEYYKIGFQFNPLIQQLSENSNIFCHNKENNEILIYDGRKYIYIYELIDQANVYQK